MIHIFYGGDELSLEEAVASMKAAIEPEELRDVNVTTLEGAEASFEQLAATCDTVPFLADRRLVVVRGLLTRFEAGRQTRGGPGEPRGLGPWEALPEYLPSLPATTGLAFADGRLSERNPLLAALRPLAEISTFPLPTGPRLRGWIRSRAATYGVEIEPPAVEALAEAVGSNTRMLDAELRKLALYRWGGAIGRQDVEEMVAHSREANIFAAVDAVLEGRTGVAIRQVHQLLEAGRPPSYVLVMIARQVRFLLLAKDLRGRGVPEGELGSRLSLSGFPLRKTLEQEGKFGHASLAHIHHKLLETDVSVKRGELDDQLALDVLIAELTTASASA